MNPISNAQTAYGPYGTQMGGYYPTGYPMLNTVSPTITSPGGNTNQGQSLQQLQQTLAQITGMSGPQAQQLQTGAGQAVSQLQANQPNYMAQEQTNIGNALGIPGLQGQTADMQKLFQLYLADKGMSTQAAQYANPGGNLNPYTNPQLMQASQQGAQQLGQQNQSDQSAVMNMTTPNQPGAVMAAPAQVPGGISDSVTGAPNPFLGSTQSVIDSTGNLPTAPSLVTSQMGAPLQGGVSLMNLLNQLIGGEQGIQSQKLDLAGNNYQGIMNAISTVANLAGTQAQNTGPGTAASVQGSLNNVKADVQKGMTFTDLLDKYTTDPNMTGAKILEEYNSIHDKPGDKWGPAQITPSMADTYGLKQTQQNLANKPVSTKTIGGEVFEYNAKTKAYDIPAGGTQAIDKSTSMLDNYLAKWKAMNPAEKYMPSTVTNAIPGAFPDRAYLDTDFFTQIEPLLRKQVVGGRITQQEMTWLRNSLPKAGDSDQSATMKIQAIKDALSQGGIGKATGTDYTSPTTPSGKSSSADPLGIL